MGEKSRPSIEQAGKSTFGALGRRTARRPALDAPEFGPGGYLPSKAAKRARKIVLREQMGFGWPLAALAAALLVAVAGVAFLRYAGRPPAAPFEAVAAANSVSATAADVVRTPDGRAALVVRAGGPLRSFQVSADATAPVWCPQTRQLETPTAAWSYDGRTVYGDAPSLQPLRSVVHDGVLYIDFATALPRPSAGSGGTAPICASGSD